MRKKTYRVKLVIDVEAENEEYAIEEFTTRVSEGAYSYKGYDISKLSERATATV